MDKKSQSNIEVWQRKELHRIYGGRKTEEGWKWRINKETYETCVMSEAKKTAVVEAHRGRSVKRKGFRSDIERRRGD